MVGRGQRTEDGEGRESQRRCDEDMGTEASMGRRFGGDEMDEDDDGFGALGYGLAV